MRHFPPVAASQASTSKVIEPAKSLPSEIVDINLKVNSCEFNKFLCIERRSKT